MDINHVPVPIGYHSWRRQVHRIKSYGPALDRSYDHYEV